MKSGAANIRTALSHVAHPTVRVVVLLVKWIRDLQILNLKAGDVVHRDLKVHADRTHLLLALLCVVTSKVDFHCQQMLDATLELVYGPISCVFALFVLK